MSNNTPYHITNFPLGFPWYKKLGSHITYWFSQIPLSVRKNSLSKLDILSIRNTLEDGDIILGGNFRDMSQVFIGGIVTHAMAYLGKGKCIHASAHGVSFIGLGKIARTYDTIIILRPYWKSKSQFFQYRNHLISKLGKPYDFFFGVKEKQEETYFCTRLINDVLQEIGYDTLLNSVREPENLIDTALDDVFRAHRILVPEEMIYGHFSVEFFSHNICYENGRYKPIETMSPFSDIH